MASDAGGRGFQPGKLRFTWRAAALAAGAAAALIFLVAAALWPSIELVPMEEPAARVPEQAAGPGIQSDAEDRDWDPLARVRREPRPAGPGAASVPPAVAAGEDAAAAGNAAGTAGPSRASSAKAPQLRDICLKLLACKGERCPKPPVLCLPWAMR